MIKGRYIGYYKPKKPMGLGKMLLCETILLWVVLTVVTYDKGDANGPATMGEAIVSGLVFSVLLMIIFGVLTTVGYPVIYARMSVGIVEDFKARLETDFPKYMKRTFIYADYNFSASGYVPSCLAYDGKNIIIMSEGHYTILGWEDIRAWSWELAGVQQTTGGDPLLNKSSDILANMKAGQKSGFTISVVDVNQPSLFFLTGVGDEAKKTCEKWMEIFKQIKEGRISIEKAAIK